ncbi:hypothetical protein SPRG_07019 [Saprolegnia parasitica CBS 223.65]|uniref:Uncharacterized protein n=1 Tax=Saprolegnia parasitica (strain CBS 223.65) TaxID=695850 RepID=A0A067CLK2_SAPPC|nr:hypothetical protein SPRG_07019 [Saprolegnia parasitica CBS 223.65]KDO27431.1 hypothetical protein SPRG_07019 [Saprolegnia parasitica CBS 223.65]|eukprot:XP_012201870.1 hypothetical protein SPRG_07019 [Saprolegnia parasitica CBS 223.65]
MRNIVYDTLLLGTQDCGSSLVVLQGQFDVLRAIFKHHALAWVTHIDVASPGYLRLGVTAEDREDDDLTRPLPSEPLDVRGHFPLPMTETIDGVLQLRQLHVNMMPIYMDTYSALPPDLERYQQLILACVRRLPFDERGNVGYLTVYEGYVDAGTSQRRGGLYIEAPNAKHQDLVDACAGGGTVECTVEEKYWGDGYWGDGSIVKKKVAGGIFIASSVADSCEVWNCTIEDKDEVAGPFGGIECLRGVLRDCDSIKLDVYELLWLTDRTPHESLLLPTGTYRQFFRLVTSNVSLWFADHSTANSLGCVPTARIVHGNKFATTPIAQGHLMLTAMALSSYGM